VAASPNPTWPAISAGRLKAVARLLSGKGRQAAGAFLAEGPQAVREALASGDVSLVVVESERSTPAAQALAVTADQMGVPVVAVGETDISAITDTVHGQGIVAVCRRRLAHLDDLARPRLVLILDEVRDPGNVGTLIRTADAFGADAVIAITGTAEPWNPKSVRASVGSVFHLPVVTGVGFDEVTAWAARQGLCLLAADGAGVPLDDEVVVVRLREAVAWVVGNEASGLSPEHKAAADLAVSVPMRGQAESLNVASAAAICLYVTAAAGP